MLKIFLNGETGKMGSCISSLIDNDDGLELVNQDRLKNADVVIDYSHPDSTASILQECIRLHKPMVIGTTGIKKRKRAGNIQTKQGMIIFNVYIIH